MGQSLHNSSSFQLIRSAQRGEAEAVEALCQRYLPKLTRWAHGRLPRWARDLVNTDDLVQETILSSLHRVDGFVYRREGAFQAYLRQALLNRVRNEVSRARRAPLAQSLGEEAVKRPSPLEELLSRDQLLLFDQAFAMLKPQQQEAIMGRFEMGLKYQELAEALNKPSPDAARMAVKRAVKKLIRLMSEPHD